MWQPTNASPPIRPFAITYQALLAVLTEPLAPVLLALVLLGNTLLFSTASQWLSHEFLTQLFEEGPLAYELIFFVTLLVVGVVLTWTTMGAALIYLYQKNRARFVQQPQPPAAEPSSFKVTPEAETIAPQPVTDDTLSPPDDRRARDVKGSRECSPWSNTLSKLGASSILGLFLCLTLITACLSLGAGGILFLQRAFLLDQPSPSIISTAALWALIAAPSLFLLGLASLGGLLANTRLAEVWISIAHPWTGLKFWGQAVIDLLLYFLIAWRLVSALSLVISPLLLVAGLAALAAFFSSVTAAQIAFLAIYAVCLSVGCLWFGIGLERGMRLQDDKTG